MNSDGSIGCCVDWILNMMKKFEEVAKRMISLEANKEAQAAIQIIQTMAKALATQKQKNQNNDTNHNNLPSTRMNKEINRPSELLDLSCPSTLTDRLDWCRQLFIGEIKGSVTNLALIKSLLKYWLDLSHLKKGSEEEVSEFIAKEIHIALGDQKEAEKSINQLESGLDHSFINPLIAGPIATILLNHLNIWLNDIEWATQQIKIYSREQVGRQ